MQICEFTMLIINHKMIFKVAVQITSMQLGVFLRKGET